MLPKKSSNTSNSTPNDPAKKIASARNQLLLMAVGLGVFLLTATALLAQPHFVTVDIGTATVHAQLAASTSAMAKGLGGRESLHVGEGMLFVFSSPSRWQIWMKNMRFPIDIVWLNQQKQVVWVEHNVSPATYPSLFMPPSDASYVIELPAGTAQQSLITRGTTAIFTLPPL